MLDGLKEEVAFKVREREAWCPGAVFRTTVCLLSKDLAPLKEIYFSTFPMLAPTAEPFYSWIGPPGEVSLADEAGKAILKSTDAKNIQGLIDSGGKAPHQTGQVVFVASLPELGQASATAQSVANTWAVFASSGVTWIPLLLVVVPPGNSQNMRGRLQALLTALEEKRVNLASLFMAGPRASSGYSLANLEDSCAVAAHLVQWFTRCAAIGNPGDWVERINPARTELPVAGFGAFTLALPMQAIMTTAAMARGAKLLEQACEINESAEHGYYVQRFQNEHNLLSSQTVQEDLYRDSDGNPLPNPLLEFPDRQGLSTEGFIATLDALDASLAGIASDQGATMKGTAKARLAVWRNSIEDFIASIVNSEQGGLRVAERFTKELGEKVQALVPKQIHEVQFQDPSGAIRGFEALLKRLPSLGARLARAALIVICAGVGFALPLGAGNNLPLAVTAIVAPLAITLLVHWLRAREVSGKVMRIQTLFDTKWSALLSSRKLEAVVECAKPFGEHVLAVHAELEGALRRSAELQEYLRESYVVELPAENASLRFTPRDRDSILDIASGIQVAWAERVHFFLGQRKPLLAWRRFSSPRPNKAADKVADKAAPKAPPAKPNPWEWNLIEQAALAVLPDCAPLLEKTILGQLGAQDDGAFQKWLALFTAATEPLIRIDPEKCKGELRGSLETAGSKEDAIVKKVHDGLSHSFGNLEIVEESSSPYRLTALGRRLGVAVEHIVD